MKCPHCGKTLWFVKSFCPICNTPITEKGRTVLQQAETQERKKQELPRAKACSQCGNITANNAPACPQCGNTSFTRLQQEGDLDLCFFCGQTGFFENGLCPSCHKPKQDAEKIGEDEEVLSVIERVTYKPILIAGVLGDIFITPNRFCYIGYAGTSASGGLGVALGLTAGVPGLLLASVLNGGHTSDEEELAECERILHWGMPLSQRIKDTSSTVMLQRREVAKVEVGVLLAIRTDYETYLFDIEGLRDPMFGLKNGILDADVAYLNIGALASRIRSQSDNVSKFLWECLHDSVKNTVAMLADYTGSRRSTAYINAVSTISASLCRIIERPDLYDQACFQAVRFTPTICNMLNQKIVGNTYVLRNRLLLQDVYRRELKRHPLACVDDILRWVSGENTDDASETVRPYPAPMLLLNSLQTSKQCSLSHETLERIALDAEYMYNLWRIIRLLNDFNHRKIVAAIGALPEVLSVKLRDYEG